MPTPSSSSTAYASSSDMTARYDVRTLCQLVSDTETAASPASLGANTRLSTCLLDASGMVEAAALAARTYTPDDLAALDGAGLAYLKRLVCDLAMGLLYLARPDPELEPPKTYELAMEALDKIRKGELVFGLLEQQQAGVLQHTVETSRNVDDRNGLIVEADRYFSTRMNRLSKP